MSRPPLPSPSYPRFYDSEHERQRILEARNKPRALLRKQSQHTPRARELQLVDDPPSTGVLAWVDRFVAPTPASPTLPSTLHVQVSPDDSTYRIRNVNV
ncbi:hypothetical protein FRB90_007397, partial [Tulasnella sp. 427]